MTITTSEKASDINPNDTTALDEKGAALDFLQNYTGALKYTDRTLAINSSNGVALVTKGRLLDILGNHTKAIGYYNEALDSKYLDNLLKANPRDYG